MWYNLRPVKMVSIKTTKNNQSWQAYGGNKTLIHCWYECLIQSLWTSIWRLVLKIKNKDQVNCTGIKALALHLADLSTIPGRLYMWWVLQALTGEIPKYRSRSNPMNNVRYGPKTKKKKNKKEEIKIKCDIYS